MCGIVPLQPRRHSCLFFFTGHAKQGSKKHFRSRDFMKDNSNAAQTLSLYLSIYLYDR
jgi:hypothetical protein